MKKEKKVQPRNSKCKARPAAAAAANHIDREGAFESVLKETEQMTLWIIIFGCQA